MSHKKPTYFYAVILVREFIVAENNGLVNAFLRSVSLDRLWLVHHRAFVIFQKYSIDFYITSESCSLQRRSSRCHSKSKLFQGGLIISATRLLHSKLNLGTVRKPKIIDMVCASVQQSPNRSSCKNRLL